jgi:RNA polymerase sigma-70 factor (ECF subfamily)
VIDTDVAAVVAGVHRAEWARIVATLIRLTGDWALAEDAAQDAFTAALTRWPVDGVPERPGAWLTAVARNRAVDRLRSHAADDARQRAQSVAAPTIEHEIEDDRLRLIFTCCHPALPLDARVALTLRTVAGLEVADVARAFLVTEPTMAQRLVRARRKIQHAAIPYRVPPAELLEARLAGVLAVLYLAFNAGYSDVARFPVADSAISVTQSLVDLMPQEPEARGLLALMLFQHSRRAARVNGAGELLTMEEQERPRWNVSDILRARSELRAAHGRRGQYVLQAAIAECYAAAPTADATDWRRVIALYDELWQLNPTPVVGLNRAVAVGIGQSPEMGLLLIDELAGELGDYHLLPAARGDLLRRAGRADEARRQLELACDVAPTDLERRQLQRRLTALDG